jgi:SAM-dependent methyltransferase
MPFRRSQPLDDLSSLYDPVFFREIDFGSSRSAARIVPELIQLISPTSVVDVGCGRGTWLAEFQRGGVTDVLGIDGAWVDRRHVQSEHFLAHDLRNPLTLDRKFDLVISLEVAEHLPPERAEDFVSDLTALGPVVAFSASILDCTGTGEINQQWPDYWADIFAKFGFTPLDDLRFKFWNDPQIEWWYRQNMILYAHRDYIAARPHWRAMQERQPPKVLRLVHPENYSEKMGMLLEPELRQLFRVLPRATLGTIRRRWRRLSGTRSSA